MTDLNINICSICLADLDNNSYTIPECHHAFHQNCIIEWYRRVGSECRCPLCRSSPEVDQIFHFSSRLDTIKMYKQISKKKNCPDFIKSLCSQHTNYIKKQVEVKKEIREFTKQNQEIFNKYKKLHRKWNKYYQDKRNIENQLLDLPQLFLIRFML